METESESNNKKRLAFLGYSEFDKGLPWWNSSDGRVGQASGIPLYRPRPAESGATHTVRAYAITSYRG